MKKLYIFILFTIYSYTNCCAQEVSGIYPLVLSDDSFSSIKHLDQEVANKELFFSGETHLISNNRRRHIYLFKYLYLKSNVRYYVIEANYSYAYLFDRYIQTGEDQYLDDMEWMTQEYRLFLDGMYQFNASLAESNKVHILSTDSESFHRGIYKRVLDDLLIGKGKVPLEISVQIEKIKQIQRNKSKGFGMDIRGEDFNPINKILENARNDFEINKEMYRDFFKNDLIHYLMIINNYATILRSDKNIAKNFLNHIYPNYKDGNFYFQYGNLHMRYKKGWLADILKSEKKLENKCLNFVSHCNNCHFRYMGKDVRFLENSGVLTYNYLNKHINYFVESTKTNYSIISTNIGKEFEKLNRMADYLIFIKNEEAEK